MLTSSGQANGGRGPADKGSSDQAIPGGRSAGDPNPAGSCGMEPSGLGQDTPAITHFVAWLREKWHEAVEEVHGKA